MRKKKMKKIFLFEVFVDQLWPLIKKLRLWFDKNTKRMNNKLKLQKLHGELKFRTMVVVMKTTIFWKITIDQYFQFLKVTFDRKD